MPDPVILSAGSLHLDVIVEAPGLPRPDQTVTGTAVTYAFGGKGGNQAAAAARAGAEAHMAGATGTDDFAATLRAALDSAHVRRAGVQTHPGPSGMSVAILDPEGTYGAVIVSGANLLYRPEATAFPKRCAALLLQNEIPEAANLHLARRAASAGIRVILNAAPARPTSPELLRLTDLLIVNRGEAADLLGLPEATLNPGDAAKALTALGPKATIVTLGADGLAADRFIQSPILAKVISTHGAGDAFTGALAAEWARGIPLEHAARFAQAAASLHVATPPADRAAITETAIRQRLTG
ncbi:PfkB family carbohydrate kinase [Tabrizicola sp. BL-A-41-H6]|uniref:PfkB family carbohydrate kinase n=1 Tax=Tabrizicola sp. BL-A-41-H6 TaxID=3421107 RepID=UPI003D6788DC